MKALLLGATGLIGSQLLDLLLKDDQYEQVIALVRKAIPLKHAKLKLIVLDNFDKLASIQEQLQADHVFCCLGTTIKIAKTKEKFQKVDLEYPRQIAELTLANGANTFLLVSSLGADPNSLFFYNKVKGKIENYLKTMKFPCLGIFRPSLLLGERKEERPGEKWSGPLLKTLNVLSLTLLSSYLPIEGKTVAQGMLSFAKSQKQGIYVLESKNIKKLAS